MIDERGEGRKGADTYSRYRRRALGEGKKIGTLPSQLKGERGRFLPGEEGQVGLFFVKGGSMFQG